MNCLTEKERIQILIEEARCTSQNLAPSNDDQIRTGLDRVQTLLNTPAKLRNQLALLVSAALRQIQETERISIDMLIGDGDLTHYEMAAIVRIRLICAELIHCLDDAMQAQRLAPVKVQKRLG
jgi:hypothetical protein